jgi:predicted enzyme related to lactoylglutathione lyase
MKNKIIHWEIGGTNGEKMNKFYSSLFDWKIQHSPEMNYYMCDLGEGNVGGGMMQIDESQGMKPYVTFYVEVDDLQAYLDKAVKLGATVVMPPMEISPEIGSMAMFMDPDMNMIGLFKTP